MITPTTLPGLLHFSKTGLGSGLLVLVILTLQNQCLASAPTLSLPARPPDSMTGHQFCERVETLEFAAREKEIVSQILRGNVPGFLRTLRAIQVTNILGHQTNYATFYVTPEYLAIGSDVDYFLAPMSPQAAQTIADSLKCSLPTRKMVDSIYNSAPLKLVPSPISPSPAMTTVAVFSNHNFAVRQQRLTFLAAQPLGTLVAGHKKDVVISARLTNAAGKVAIYGWHQTNGLPIQPLYLGHGCAWVDYSQCIRLVDQRVMVNGKAMPLGDVLADPLLSGLVSDEGLLKVSCYPTNAIAGGVEPTPDATKVKVSGFSGFQTSTSFHEKVAWFNIQPEVKVYLNLPGSSESHPNSSSLLIIYALPNGNSTAQTVGKTLKPGDDWHYDIQHIGAQTRFLREMMPERTIIIAYLESGPRSWPAWRQSHGDQPIPKILSEIKNLCPTNDTEIVLSGHSGGGSFIFGYLNAIDKIPENVVRIAFLDSDYGYDRDLGHDHKLAGWLKANASHYLCVLAYDDANALLDGKPFVTANGGTWGRSHAMQADLGRLIEFSAKTNANFELFRV